MSLFKSLTEAMDHFIDNGYDSVSALEYWLHILKNESIKEMGSEKDLLHKLEKSLKSTFTRLTEKNSLISANVSRFDINKIKPKLRAELDKRIVASANLIKLNREEAIEKILRRFSGWATSIPLGGTKSVKKVKEKDDIKKSISKIPFEERRVIIDQTHKLTASIRDIVALDNGAIAAEWNSHWRQANYNYRKDHKERDEKVYVIKGSWADNEGYIKAKNGYIDDITMPGEEVYCRCYYKYIYTLGKMPESMLTKKAKIKLNIIDK